MAAAFPTVNTGREISGHGMSDCDRKFLGNVCGMPGACHCGDVGKYTDFYQESFLQAWPGMGGDEYRCRKGGRSSALFPDRFSQDGDVGTDGSFTGCSR